MVCLFLLVLFYVYNLILMRNTTDISTKFYVINLQVFFASQHSENLRIWRIHFSETTYVIYM
uniref:Uncharacterized protein n=1 Tax=Anguilla anguilla TaxID=7936 RepID=A0A0E9SX55_ANGAN